MSISDLEEGVYTLTNGKFMTMVIEARDGRGTHVKRVERIRLLMSMIAILNPFGGSELQQV